MKRTDHLSRAQRSALMSKIRSKHTKPELAVRKMVSSLGHGYRLHHKKLPGCPDLSFVSQKKAIFVHGCFWHLHHCRDGRVPKTRRRFWLRKLTRNEERDASAMDQLGRLGYSVLVIWECELDNGLKEVMRRLRRFLGKSPSAGQARGDELLVKLARKARAEGAPYSLIERQLGLRPARGMNAWRLCN